MVSQGQHQDMPPQALRKFSPIQSTTAYRMVAETIERDIFSGRLRSGDPLQRPDGHHRQREQGGDQHQQAGWVGLGPEQFVPEVRYTVDRHSPAA
jgi:hypothetical protein